MSGVGLIMGGRMTVSGSNQIDGSINPLCCIILTHGALTISCTFADHYAAIAAVNTSWKLTFVALLAQCHYCVGRSEITKKINKNGSK